MKIATFAVEERDDGWIYVHLPPVEELDQALGTEKWKVKKGETPCQFGKLDEKIRMKVGRKGQRMNGDPAARASGLTNGHDGLAVEHDGIDW